MVKNIQIIVNHTDSTLRSILVKIKKYHKVSDKLFIAVYVFIVVSFIMALLSLQSITSYVFEQKYIIPLELAIFLGIGATLVLILSTFAWYRGWKKNKELIYNNFRKV